MKTYGYVVRQPADLENKTLNYDAGADLPFAAKRRRAELRRVDFFALAGNSVRPAPKSIASRPNPCCGKLTSSPAADISRDRPPATSSSAAGRIPHVGSIRQPA